jgi:hypothetical protein
MMEPPRTAELLLQSFGASTQYVEPLLGDLAEGFALRAGQEGVRSARRWYWREALRATPHVLREGVTSLHVRDVKHIAGVVLAAYFLVFMVAFFASMVAGAVMSALQVIPGRFAQPGDPMFYVGYVLGFGCTVLGGVFAAWLDERTPVLSALALGIVWASLSIGAMALGHGSGGAWLRVVVPSMTVTGVMLGGFLRIRARVIEPPAGGHAATDSTH